MPKAILKCENPETFKVIMDLAKYLDFEILSISYSKKKFDDILIPGDKTIDSSYLTELFTGKKTYAAKLRKEAWKRKFY